jgi:competence protein ComEA
MPPDLIAPPARSRVRVALGGAVVLALVGFAVAVLVSLIGPHGTTTVVTTPHPISTATAGGLAGSDSAGPVATGAVIYVHVVGAVARPGLFPLHQGDRAVDAVTAAGGFSVSADQSQLNLARVLVDGEQIVVPVVGAAAPLSTGAATPGGAVNLNSATEAELEELPRVGPAMAKRIIDWRTKNGRFSAIEDLMSVTGIGQKTFDGLKDLITI